MPLVTPDLDYPVNHSIDLLKGVMCVFELNNNADFLTLDVILEDLPIVSKAWSDGFYKHNNVPELMRILNFVERMQTAGVTCQYWHMGHDLKHAINPGMGYFHGFVAEALLRLKDPQAFQKKKEEEQARYYLLNSKIYKKRKE